MLLSVAMRVLGPSDKTLEAYSILPNTSTPSRGSLYLHEIHPTALLLGYEALAT